MTDDDLYCAVHVVPDVPHDRWPARLAGVIGVLPVGRKRTWEIGTETLDVTVGVNELFVKSLHLADPADWLFWPAKLEIEPAKPCDFREEVRSLVGKLNSAGLRAVAVTGEGPPAT